MAELIIARKNAAPARFTLQKQVMVAGTDPSHDLRLEDAPAGVMFTLIREESGRTQLMPGRHKLKVNGFAVNRTINLSLCDRIEWQDGSAVFLEGLKAASAAQPPQAAALKSLEILQELADAMQSPGSVSLALHRLLGSLVEMAGAESGSLLSGAGGTGWELTASFGPENTLDPSVRRKELFSNTILQDSMKRREPVCVENIIGHPWSEAASVIEARIFSAACLPLVISEQIVGAIFLVSRSPGKSIRKERLEELGLLATQAALLLGLQAELRSARKENARLRTLVKENRPDTGGLVFTPSSPMAEVSRKIDRLAPTLLSVILLGETGTGKEVVARELHRRGARAQGPFVAINCAAIPAALLESTLFGHEKGAFTGAVRAHAGKFQQAEGGTLFLDEIGDLPIELQAKILRALQDKTVEPVGASRGVPVDVRVIAATHQDLDLAIKENRFRGDLFFRLSGAILKLPALRERASDLEALAQHFIRATGAQASLSPEAMNALNLHPWPGNIRELEQVMTRAALLCTGGVIRVEDLELREGYVPTGLWSTAELNLEEAQAAFTQEFVRKALLQRAGNRAETAAALGVSERTLYRILAEGRDPSGR